MYHRAVAVRFASVCEQPCRGDKCGLACDSISANAADECNRGRSGFIYTYGSTGPYCRRHRRAGLSRRCNVVLAVEGPEFFGLDVDKGVPDVVICEDVDNLVVVYLPKESGALNVFQILKVLNELSGPWVSIIGDLT